MVFYDSFIIVRLIPAKENIAFKKFMKVKSLFQY